MTIQRNIWKYNGNTNVWITAGGFSSGYGLTVFNESPWDVDTSYTSNTSSAAFAAAASSSTGKVTIKDTGKCIICLTGKLTVK